jgi:hypothetical protein
LRDLIVGRDSYKALNKSTIEALTESFEKIKTLLLMACRDLVKVELHKFQNIPHASLKD